MIRREDEGGFLLITQHDHALISGELAEQFGNEYFATPTPLESVLKGIRLHDAGWPLHDDQPTRNKEGLPLDVFETPREIALKVWTGSVERATANDPYAGLLVSLHVLNLSVFASTFIGFDEKPDQFAVAKFQQREIERQEKLRQKLGLRTESPSHHGGPHETTQKPEDQVNFNFRLLQAMDVISLAACCTRPPSKQTQDLMPEPGAAPIRLNLARQGKDVVVDPWPFKPPQIDLMIPVCRIEKKAYASDEELRAAANGGSAEVLTCRILSAAHP
jgi:hypothetical protein